MGRASELAEVKQHLSTAEAAPLLLLAGQPGIGKTRLLTEMAVWAHEQGFTVLRGGCRRGSEQSSFSPIVEALADHVRRLRDAGRRPPVDGCGWLVRLLPELADLIPVPAWAVPSAQERRLMFAAAARFLSNVSGPAGTLLLLDDLHWAGADAFDLLTSLVSTPEETPLRVIGAYRDTDVGAEHPVTVLQADLAREGGVYHVSVSPLAPADATALVASILLPTTAADTAQAEHLAQWAGGVPFHLVSCANGVRAGGWDGAGPTKLPFAVAASISQRMGRLSPATQTVLRSGAVIGRELPTWLVVAVAVRTDLDEEAVVSALEEACHAQLLHEAGDDTYEFTHDLIHESIRAGIPPALRRKLHRRIADALERQPTRIDRRVADLAHHLLEAGEREHALPYVLQGGDQAEAIYAHTEAEQHYRTAVELAQEVGDERREAEALEKLAPVLRFVTRYEEALALSERAATRYQNLGDVEGEGRALSLVCWICWMQRLDLHRLDQVIARAEAFLSVSAARKLSPLVQAQLHSRLGRLLIERGRVREDGAAAVADLQRALALAARGIDLAQAYRPGETLARVRATHANALLELGRLDEAVQAFEAVVPLADAPGALVPAAVALASAQYIYLCQGDFKRSHEYIERALALVERTGDMVSTVGIMVSRGRLAYYTGDWGQARTEFERAAALSAASMAEGNLTVQFSRAGLELGLLCLAEGQWEASTSYLAEPLEYAERWRDLHILRVASGMVAERDLLEGRSQAARERLAPLLDRQGMQEFQVQYVLPPLAWACLECGETELAQTLAAWSVTRAIANGQRLFLVDALRVQALIAMGLGRWRKAEANVKKSLALSQDIRYRYATAKSLYVYGQLYGAKGYPAQACEKYQAACAICEQLGEGLYRPHIERALTALSQR